MALDQYVVGLTGNIAAGKSAATDCLEYLGKSGPVPVTVIDADKVGHELYNPYHPKAQLITADRCYKEVVKAFGPGIVNTGIIDRKKLSRIVFPQNDTSAEIMRADNELARLSACVWPYISQELAYRTQNVKDIVVIEAALLYEAGWDLMCNESVVVTTQDAKRKERLMKRNGLSDTQAQKRIDAQKMTQKMKTQKADWLIRNDADRPAVPYGPNDPLLVEVKTYYDHLVDAIKNG